jgi:hypothetical protein
VHEPVEVGAGVQPFGAGAVELVPDEARLRAASLPAEATALSA